MTLSGISYVEHDFIDGIPGDSSPTPHQRIYEGHCLKDPHGNHHKEDDKNEYLTCVPIALTIFATIFAITIIIITAIQVGIIAPVA